jgi:hypothetical protein
VLVVRVTPRLEGLFDFVVNVHCFFNSTLFLLSVRDMLNAKMDHLCGFQADIFAMIVEALEKTHKVRTRTEQFVESDNWKFFSELPQHHHGCIFPHISIVWFLVHLQPINRLL